MKLCGDSLSVRRVINLPAVQGLSIDRQVSMFEEKYECFIHSSSDYSLPCVKVSIIQYSFVPGLFLKRAKKPCGENQASQQERMWSREWENSTWPVLGIS